METSVRKFRPRGLNDVSDFLYMDFRTRDLRRSKLICSFSKFRGFTAPLHDCYTSTCIHVQEIAVYDDDTAGENDTRMTVFRSKATMFFGKNNYKHQPNDGG